MLIIKLILALVESQPIKNYYFNMYLTHKISYYQLNDYTKVILLICNILIRIMTENLVLNYSLVINNNAY